MKYCTNCGKELSNSSKFCGEWKNNLTKKQKNEN
jgi:uncharacterized membrane protein YvbJ